MSSSTSKEVNTTTPPVKFKPGDKAIVIGGYIGEGGYHSIKPKTEVEIRAFNDVWEDG